jgi:hypothetical protein
VSSATSTPVDLQPPTGDPWGQVTVPAGWEPIAEIARRVSEGLGVLAERTTTDIIREIPAYAAGRVPREDVTLSVIRNLEMMLIGIAESRGPTPDEIAVRRELGARRAAQGHPIDALIQAYHVGYRELWQELVRAVPEGDTRTADLLLQAATTVWQWVHQLTNAIAEAHAETLHSREAHAIGARQRFLELVVAGDLASDEVLQLAASVGFDHTGRFQAVVARPHAFEGDEPRELQRALDETAGGAHAVVQRGPAIIALLQAADLGAALTAFAGVLDRAPVGVGLERDGLVGARTSLGDADRAVALADDGPVSFDGTWLWATLLRASPRLEVLLAPGVTVAAEHPHLAATVEAFAEAGFSVSQTARDLDLHANTVAYRLDRWKELSGWDPRTYDGLSRSLGAILLERRG